MGGGPLPPAAMARTRPPGLPAPLLCPPGPPAAPCPTPHPGPLLGTPGAPARRSALFPQGKPDLNTALPVRQTASIFKQPVTKITNHPSNKVKSDPQKAVDQPRQVSARPDLEAVPGSATLGD